MCAGKQKPKEWIQLAKEGNFEKLTKELIVEYYDKNYKKPRGDPLATYEVAIIKTYLLFCRMIEMPHNWRN